MSAALGLLLAWAPPLRAANRCAQLAGAPAEQALIPPADGEARILFEIRLTESDHTQPADVDAVLAVLEHRELVTTILASPAWSTTHPDALKRWAGRGHEIGLLFQSQRQLQTGAVEVERAHFRTWWSALKQARKIVRKTGGVQPRVIAIDRRNRAAEIAIDDLGFRALMVLDPIESAPVRRVRSYSGELGRTRVVTEGTPSDGCGAMLPGWTPAALNRATAAATEVRVLRVGLPPDPNGTALLEKWLDQVVVPSGWRVMTTSQATRLPLGTDTLIGALANRDTPVPSPVPARTVPAKEWTTAAAGIRAVDRLPRQLPGKINPTEAFGLMLTALSGDHSATEIPPADLSLLSLQPPLETARSTMGANRIPLSPEVVVHAAGTLSLESGNRIPAIVTIYTADGPLTLTAAEFLALMADVVLSEPPIARFLGDPDPHAPGGGWGDSRD